MKELTQETKNLMKAAAADALKQLEANELYRVMPGYFCDSQSLGSKSIPKRVVKNCRVCALGGLFLSLSLLRGDKALPGSGYQTMYDLIGFDRSVEIEEAFESFRRQKYSAVTDFYVSHPDPVDRFKAIMNNIIENDGEFKP